VRKHVGCVAPALVAATLSCAGTPSKTPEDSPWRISALREARVVPEERDPGQGYAVWNYQGALPGGSEDDVLVAETFSATFREGERLPSFLERALRIQKNRCDAFTFALVSSGPDGFVYEATSPGCFGLPRYEFVRAQEGAKGFHFLSVQTDVEPTDAARASWRSLLESAELVAGR